MNLYALDDLKSCLRSAKILLNFVYMFEINISWDAIHNGICRLCSLCRFVIENAERNREVCQNRHCVPDLKTVEVLFRKSNAKSICPVAVKSQHFELILVNSPPGCACGFQIILTFLFETF